MKSIAPYHVPYSHGRQQLMAQPHAFSSIGSRAFRIAAPKLWNSLLHVKLFSLIKAFKRPLGARLFAIKIMSLVTRIIIITIYFENVTFFHSKLGSDVFSRVDDQPWHFTRVNSTTFNSNSKHGKCIYYYHLYFHLLLLSILLFYSLIFILNVHF